jgi:putative transposase
MTAPENVDPAVFLREQLASASPDVLREMVKTLADALMSADARPVRPASIWDIRSTRPSDPPGLEWSMRGPPSG